MSQTGLINGIYTQAADGSANGELIRVSQQKAVGSRYYIGNIDATTIAATKVFTTDNNGLNFYYQFSRIILESSSGVVLNSFVYSLGSNASSYNNIVSNPGLSVLTTAGSFANQFPGGGIQIASIAPNTDIYINLTGAVTATTFRIGVEIFGDYK